MEWIKATERLPEVIPDQSKEFFCRLRDGSKKVCFYGKGSGSLLIRRPWDIEWLEETPEKTKNENSHQREQCP